MAAAQPERARPVAGRDYPGNFGEFVEWFQSEEDCRRYLIHLRWPDGFRCPACGHDEHWVSRRGVFICAARRAQTSAVKGTLFERSQLPLLTWFRAVWLVTSQKRGVSAATIQSELGIGSYKSAWVMHHNLRRAMLRHRHAKLSGRIEVDETYLGGPEPGKRGRGAAGKIIVAIAVEHPADRDALGRVRMRVIPNLERPTLERFVRRTCTPGSLIVTDGFTSYSHLSEIGYEHERFSPHAEGDPTHIYMPGVHRIASMLKRWILGTHQGGIAVAYAYTYLEEFTFRFNRRYSRSRGLLFYRLMQLAIRTKPLSYDRLVWARRRYFEKDEIRGVVPRSPVPVTRQRPQPRRPRAQPRRPSARHS